MRLFGYCKFQMRRFPHTGCRAMELCFEFLQRCVQAIRKVAYSQFTYCGEPPLSSVCRLSIGRFGSESSRFGVPAIGMS